MYLSSWNTSLDTPRLYQRGIKQLKLLPKHSLTITSFTMEFLSDRGANIESKATKELYTLTGTTKSRTTPYNPMGNGMTGRFNRTLIGMLGALDRQKKSYLISYVAPMIQAYKCTRHE